MPDKLRELKKKISKLPSEELLRIVNNSSEGYRAEAVIFAREELEARGPISFQENVGESSSTVEQSSRCRICGGSMRSGLLSTEKELMIIFTGLYGVWRSEVRSRFRDLIYDTGKI
jgi:hypothetical protein